MSLICTVGCSNSGKSTYAETWKREKTDKSRVVVTTDNIRRAISGKLYCRDAETQVFAYKHIFLKTLLLEGYDEILVCGTHTTRPSIQRILEIDPEAKFIVFDTPLKTCLERAVANGNNRMIPVIVRQHEQMQELLEKGLDNVVREIKGYLEWRWSKEIHND